MYVASIGNTGAKLRPEKGVVKNFVDLGGGQGGTTTREATTIAWRERNRDECLGGRFTDIVR